MTEQKTKPTKVNVEAYLKKIADPEQRKDALTVLALMKKATGLKPIMWGPSIVGFGQYYYKYPSGHEGICCLTGFAARKGSLSLYFMPGLDRFQPFLKKLGKHKTGKACLYIKKLSDVDLDVLRDMIAAGYDMMQDVVQQNQRAAADKKARKKL